MQQFMIPKELEVFIDMLNQIFEIEKKVGKIEEQNSIHRNLARLKEMFESRMPLGGNAGFLVENPIGQPYNETRTDCEASIAGNGTENLVITEVIKPVIRLRQGGFNQIIQKGIVVVESKSN
ncbi:MAG: hypothetical protein AAF570_13630 [Bacteroidota bacterium]